MKKTTMTRTFTSGLLVLGLTGLFASTATAAPGYETDDTPGQLIDPGQAPVVEPAFLGPGFCALFDFC